MRGGARPGAGRKVGGREIARRATTAEREDIGAKARQYADIALRTLQDIAENGKSESARATAAAVLLDRGFGKPRQAVEHSGPDGGAIALDVVDLRNRVASRIAGLATRIGPILDPVRTNGNGASHS